MSSLHWVDHLFFVLLVAVFPVIDRFSIRKRAAAIRAGDVEQRPKLYRSILRQEWAVAAVLVAVWLWLGRDPAGLGFSWRTGGLAWIGTAVGLVLCALLVVQARMLVNHEKGAELMRKQAGSELFLLPHTPAERRMFAVLSVTAGICEEILFRGFVIAYLIALLDVPFWPAALLSSVGFGLAHAYQGPKGIVKTGLVGGLFALLYGLTGSLWIPMLTHAVMDLTAGEAFFRASARAGAGLTPTADALET